MPRKTLLLIAYAVSISLIPVSNKTIAIKPPRFCNNYHSCKRYPDRPGTYGKSNKPHLRLQIVLQLLKSGNADFMNDELTVRNNSARVREAAIEQFPKAASLSCLDSAYQWKMFFHCGIEVVRSTRSGNITNEGINGSLGMPVK